MNAVDIIIIVVILFFAIKGVICGMIKELAGVVAILLGTFLSINFSTWLADFIRAKDWFSPDYLEVICFIVIFFGIILLVMIFSKLLNRFVSAINIQWLNKIAGFFFGEIKGFLIIGGLCYVLNKIVNYFSIADSSIFDESVVFVKVLGIFESLFV